MASRNGIAWFVLLMGISATIFFFIRQEDEIALNLLFFSLYATVTIIYFLRIFYYFDNKATLNEIYFFSLANIIPLCVLFSSLIVPIGREAILTFEIEIVPPYDIHILKVSFLLTVQSGTNRHANLQQKLSNPILWVMHESLPWY